MIAQPKTDFFYSPNRVTTRVQEASTQTSPPRLRVLLSTLWVYVLLSMLFRDMHEILRAGFVAELASSGTVRGIEVSGNTLVVSAFVLQLPLMMVVAARLLPLRWNRAANIVVAAVVAAGVVGIWPKDGDDLVFGLFQLLGLGAIFVVSLRMRFRSSPRITERKRRG